MDAIKLLLIDDNQSLRNRISEILESCDYISIIPFSGDGNMALPKMQSLNPDVILLNKEIDSQNSLGVVISLKKYFPLAKIIVMDTAPVQAHILQYLKAGASGFIFKDPTLNNFLINIRTIENSNVLPQFLDDSLFSKIVDHAATENKLKTKPVITLTRKEQKVIELLSKSKGNQEIGKGLKVSMIEVNDLIHKIVVKQSKIISEKLINILKLFDLLRQFPKVNGWSIINLSAKYDLTKSSGIHSPRRANSFMILLPNEVNLFFYVSRTNQKLVSMQEFLRKKNTALKEHLHKYSLIKKSQWIKKEIQLDRSISIIK